MNAVAFLWGFSFALLYHVARVLLWGMLVCIAAILLGYQPSWSLLFLLFVSNALACLIYPPESES